MRISDWSSDVCSSDLAVAAAGHLAEAGAEQDQQVALADPRRQPRIDADADVAGVAGMLIVEIVLAAEGYGHRQPRGRRQGLQLRLGLGAPAAATDDDERPLRARQSLPQDRKRTRLN